MAGTGPHQNLSKEHTCLKMVTGSEHQQCRRLEFGPGFFLLRILFQNLPASRHGLGEVQDLEVHLSWAREIVPLRRNHLKKEFGFRLCLYRHFLL